MQHKTSIRVIVVYLISTFVCLFLILDPRLCYICHHFSAPKTKAQVQYCDHALSVVRPSSLTFHIFDFSSESAERNSTKLDRKQDLIVYCRACFFFGLIRKKQDDRPGRSVKKVAHCTQVNDIWPFGPLVLSWIYL